MSSTMRGSSPLAPRTLGSDPMTDQLRPGDVIRPDDDVPEAADIVVCIAAKRGEYRVLMLDKDERILMMVSLTGEELERVVGHMKRALELNRPGGPPIPRPPHVVKLTP